MFNFFKKLIKEQVDKIKSRFTKIKNYYNNNKKVINWSIYLVIFVLFVIVMFLAVYGVTPKWMDKLLYPKGNNIANLSRLFFRGHVIYIIYMLAYIKSLVYLAIIDGFKIITADWLFSQVNIFNMEVFIFKSWEIFYKQGDASLLWFYEHFYAGNLLSYLCTKYELGMYGRKLTFFAYSISLPNFFYFGLLFITTTIFSLFLLSYYGFYGVFFLNLITILMFWISSILHFNIFFIDGIFYKINLGKWFVINMNQPITFDLYIDAISYSFMFLTLTIAVFVYIYTFSYFRYEPNVERLILLINCFVISMICLVTSGNFFVLFLGWELIGLTSFFLINFWSTRVSTLKSAFKAFVFNKFSDVSLLIGVFLVFFCINDVNIISFNKQISLYNNFYLNILDNQIPLIELLSFFFVTCSFVKSAQFGFHIWLPDSMEAPVPASALIHSATLVSAGVFVLLRLSPLFEYSLYSYYVVPIIGSFTAFFGGLCSVYQSDIKKILAYSTISHCGFLMVCYSTYIPEFTVLYLYIHGFFKAAVFLCVGNVIRFSRNYQDFRRMGMFWKYLPFECFSSFICLMNLCGLPFTIGFYIKHLLLLGVNMNNMFLYFIFVNILGGAVFGLIYSYRLFYYVFFDFKKAKKIIYTQANRKILKSYFYSNTTLAANIAIFGIIVTAYVVCGYLLSIFLNKSTLGDGLNIYSVNPSQYEEFNHPMLTTINNIGYFNWILLIVIIIICLASWRLVYNYYNVMDLFSSLLLFSMFFYMFYCILTLL